MAPKEGENELRIPCVFFSNPRDRENSHWEIEEALEPTSETGAMDEENVSTPEMIDHVGHLGHDETGDESGHEFTTPADPATNALDENKLIRLFENKETAHYIYTVEPYAADGQDNTGLYRAVLKIKNIRPSDYKNYTFRLFEQHRTIRVYANESKLHKTFFFQPKSRFSLFTTIQNMLRLKKNSNIFLRVT